MSGIFSQTVPRFPAPPPPNLPSTAGATTKRHPFTSAQLQIEQWREQMLHASQVDPRCISLAQSIMAIDQDDEQVIRSKKQRLSTAQSQGDAHRQELRDTVAVLHHLDPDTRRAMIRCNYKELARCRLPFQLIEQITDATVKQRTIDVESITNDQRRSGNYAEYRPVIYQHYLVDKDGMPPTYNQFSKIVQNVQNYEDYVSALDHGKMPTGSLRDVVQEMCEEFLAPTEDDKTRDLYDFDPRQPRYGRSSRFMLALEQWRDVVDEAIHKQPTLERNERLYICSETGWTMKPNERRFKQREHGNSSNKVMNLIEVAARVAFPADDFHMQWIIVAEILDPYYASPAERVISRLSSSYTTCGGTNGEMGGLSNRSANNLNPFLAACDRGAHAMKKSVEAEREVVSKEEAIFDGVQTTRKQISELKSCQKRFYDLEKRIEQVYRKIEKLTDRIDEVAPEWAKVVENKEADKMVRFGKKLDAILEG